LIKVNRNAEAACFAAMLLVAASEGAVAQAQLNLSAAETCLEANREISLGVSLPRTASRFNASGPLRIVAVGSSSTSGLWFWNSAATYPEVMRRELTSLRPRVQIEIINSGRIGDTISGAIDRFERDVLAYDPDLIIWQLGTNDVAWGGRADGLKDRVIVGVRMLKAKRADVVLMDLQYTPMVRASSEHSTMQAIIADVARQERVGLFPRFALMRRSIEAGLSPGALVSWDGLHNSDAGYDCVGRALARAVHAAAR
jgi:acyl-CoA thioesterase-1